MAVMAIGVWLLLVLVMTYGLILLMMILVLFDMAMAIIIIICVCLFLFLSSFCGSSWLWPSFLLLLMAFIISISFISNGYYFNNGINGYFY